MTQEIGVYAAVIKDVIFGVICLVLFYIVRYPQWIYFAGHSFTWLLFFLYFASDGQSLWLSTLALSISVAIVLLDIWICLTLTCFLGDYCCIGDAEDAPFSFAMQVCGKNNRYETDSFVYIAVTTVGIAIVNGISRTSSMYNTRSSASMYLVGAVAYIMLKVYLLVWRNVQYSSFFITITVLSMAAMFSGVSVSLRYRFVATCLFLFVMLIDMSIVLGATNAVKFLNNYTLETKKVYFPSARRRLFQTTETDPTDGMPESHTALLVFAFERFPTSAARTALGNATAALAAYASDPATATASAEWATALVDKCKDYFDKFVDGLRASVEELHRDSVASTEVSLELKTRSADLLAHADAVHYVLSETHCCDPNTRFDLTIARLSAQLAEYDVHFDQEFYGKTLLMMAAVQSAESAVAATPQVSNEEIKGWVQAMQHFLLKIWKSVTGTANSITVNTILPVSAQSADLAVAAAAKATEYANQVAGMISSQAAVACAVAAAAARAQAQAAKAAASAAASLGETLASQTAAVAAARAAQAEALTAGAAYELANNVEGAATKLAAAAAASAVATAEASRAALTAASEAVKTAVTDAAAQAANSAAKAAQESTSAVTEVVNDTGKDITDKATRASEAALSAASFAESAARSLLRLFPTFGKSPWLNVPKFIRVIWVVIHCLCAAFNFMCIVSVWTRDITWQTLFGAGLRKKYELPSLPRGSAEPDDSATVAMVAHDRFQGGLKSLNRRMTGGKTSAEYSQVNV
jgi:hypothetical protein